MSLRFCSYLLDQKCQMLIRTIIEFFLAVDESCIPLSILQEIMFVAVRVVNTCCSQSSIRSFIESAINTVDLFLYYRESNLLYTKWVTIVLICGGKSNLSKFFDVYIFWMSIHCYVYYMQYIIHVVIIIFINL